MFDVNFDREHITIFINNIFSFRSSRFAFTKVAVRIIGQADRQILINNHFHYRK